MNNHFYCVIMAGGIGSRFWPLSRESKPKQFVDILGIGKTFIQLTYERFSSFISPENFMVVTGKAYKEQVLEQLPALKEEQVWLEPERRNTAPCLAYAAYKLREKDPDAVMVVTPADHLIIDTATFSRVMQQSLAYAAGQDRLVTIGITPTFPSTGYGYIEVGDKHAAFSRVLSFKEKPDYDRAKSFLEHGGYVWNSGMFVWSVNTIIREMIVWLPHIADAFAGLAESYWTPGEQSAVDKVYAASRSISIDFGVMEKSHKVDVTCADFGWSDLGTWTSLYEQSGKDEAENVLSGEQIIANDTRNCFVKELNPNKLVVADGLEDLLIVDTEDVLLICLRTDEGQVKQIIERAVSRKKGYAQS